MCPPTPSKVGFLVIKRKTEPAPGDKAPDFQSSSPAVTVSPYTAPASPEPEEETITATLKMMESK